jgi:C-terminal processing protease CtpA/Prc
MKKLCVILILFCLAANVATAQTIVTAKDLQADFAIMRKSYETLHPGLYKYEDKATIDGYFEACKKALDHDQTLQEAYLNFAKLTAKFKCGHSYANFFNQEEPLKKELFEGKNALPVHFRLIEDRMLVTKSADPMLMEGVEIKTINGTPVKKIIETLLPLVRADGSNDGKRRKLLEISGQFFEYFDIFYPMIFPMKSATFDLDIYDFKTKKDNKITISAVNHQERETVIKEKYKVAEKIIAELKWLDKETAVMNLNTFSTYDNKFDFDKFYLNSMTEYQQKGGKNLIIDIRKNEGGDVEVGKKMMRYLINKPIGITEEQDSWAYLSIDSTLKPYVDNKSWASGWFDRTIRSFIKMPSGQYRLKSAGKADTLKPKDLHIATNVYLLINATNSSATFVFAQMLKEQKLATLVGQMTGGNQKGITAGALFFMLLPNSKIEVDVPLIGMNYDLAKTRPDAGIAPDVYVKPSIEDVVNGIDTEMEAVKNLILKAGKK